MKLSFEAFNSYENESTFYNTSTPERLLLAALLERAFRDLNDNIEVEFKRDAIRWFQQRDCIGHENTIDISFSTVIEALELSTQQVSYILERVDLAERKVSNVPKIKTIRYRRGKM